MRSRLEFALLLGILVGWASAAPVLAAAPSAAALKQSTARCLARQGLDACDDAIRRNPGDPALLVALADLELRGKHPAEALRHYRRAAELEPDLKGLAAKIAAAEAQLHPKHTSGAARPAPKPTTAQGRQFSNAAPMTESH